MMRVALIGLAFSPAFSAAVFAQRQVTATTHPEQAVPDSSYSMPNNFYGAHLLVDDARPGTRGFKHLQWARCLVGRWGYAKTLMSGIDAGTVEPRPGWVDYVNRCYELEMIPVCRLGGIYRDGGWVAPKPDAPGDYKSLAAAIKRVVEKLPRSNLCPLYIEIWNEPNLAVEWSGKPNPREYADFFVQAAEAIRSIDDPRIRILNGGLGTSAEWAEKLCKVNPKFIRSFDVWASHPYPHNHPPSVNFHDKTAPPGTDLTIDSYTLELDAIKRLGRPDAKVMLTETGYDLGNSVHVKAGYPIINEQNRADYMMRAFRDYWSKWPEIVAIFPFELCREDWERFDWVYPDSGTNPDGSPTRPHYQYSVIAAMAKPTDTTGAITGTVTIATLDSRLEGAKVTLFHESQGALTDPMGNFVLPRLSPGSHLVRIAKNGFAAFEKKITVAKGANATCDASLAAIEKTTLTGEVTSGDTGKPLPEVSVKLTPGEWSATTDRHGRYEFKLVVPAKYTLTATLKQHHAYKAENVEVPLLGRPHHDFVLGLSQASAAENMLSNPSFEAGGGGGAKMEIGLGFEPLVPPGPGFREGLAGLSDKFVHTGRWSQSIRMRPDETIIRQITHYGQGQPGTHYTAGAWVRVDAGDHQAAAWISLDATRNDGSVIGHRPVKKKLEGRSDNWVWLEVTETAPPGTQRISVNLHAQGKSGAAYFDDVVLVGKRGMEKQ